MIIEVLIGVVAGSIIWDTIKDRIEAERKAQRAKRTELRLIALQLDTIAAIVTGRSAMTNETRRQEQERTAFVQVIVENQQAMAGALKAGEELQKVSDRFCEVLKQLREEKE